MSGFKLSDFRTSGSFQVFRGINPTPDNPQVLVSQHDVDTKAYQAVIADAALTGTVDYEVRPPSKIFKFRFDEVGAPIPIPPSPPAPDIPVPPPPPPPAPIVLAKISERVLGACIGENKNYDDPAYIDQIARVSGAIMSFYVGWRGDVRGNKIRPVLQAIRAKNPKAFLAQYTILNEARTALTGDASMDVAKKVTDENWWLRNAAGQPLSWTSQFNAMDINYTEWTAPDANGDRYPQWRAKRDFDRFFSVCPEFNAWYFDNAMPPRTPPADWKLDGVDRETRRGKPGRDAEVLAACRRGHVAEWAVARALRPGIDLIVNAADPDGEIGEPEWKGKADHAFLETMIQPTNADARESWAGWKGCYDRYRRAEGNFPGWVALNTKGAADAYQTMRYGLCTALLGNGRFTYTVGGYDSVPYFDEYDVALGQPLSSTPPPTTAWQAGVYRRDYEGGMVLVNPSKTNSALVACPPGFRRIDGAQDRRVNNGEPAGDVEIGPRDGLILVRT